MNHAWFVKMKGKINKSVGADSNKLPSLSTIVENDFLSDHDSAKIQTSAMNADVVLEPLELID